MSRGGIPPLGPIWVKPPILRSARWRLEVPPHTSHHGGKIHILKIIENIKSKIIASPQALLFSISSRTGYLPTDTHGLA